MNRAELALELEKTAQELESLAENSKESNSATDYISGLLEKVVQK